MRPDRRVDSLLLTSTFAGFFAMALYAIFTPLGLLDMRGTRLVVQSLCGLGLVGRGPV